MKLRFSIHLIVILAVVLGLLPVVAVAAPAPTTPTDKIEAQLLDLFAVKGSGDFVVEFRAQADLSPAYKMGWTERGEFVYNTLQAFAASTQAQAKSIVGGMGLKSQTFIAGNELYVFAGSQAAAETLAALPEVRHIRAPIVVYLDPIVETPAPQGADALAWGISYTKADQFWTAFGVQGDGIKVANIDTGVQYNHPALDQSFACATPTDPACWSDPSNICGAAGACDNAGHGTHTMGTMVADDDPSLTWQAGMAPNATWIACKGCESNSCSDFALNSCADWLLAPGGSTTNRPNVVNNSWGGGGGSTWYLAKVQAWIAAGIFPAFSAGNSGPTCTSMGDPGTYQESFTSAAIDVNGNIAGFSSRGPSPFGHDPYTKPNIAAPGVSVCSSVPGNGWDCGYSGTSMASPHSAGAVALLWSCNPDLVGQIDPTFQILQNSATAAPAGNCGAPPDGEGNYTFGYGYLDVLAAGVLACGGVDTGHIEGHVYDTVGNPIAGATVAATPVVKGGAQIDAVTDPTGYYTMTLVVATYDVTASKANYTSQTVNGIEVLADQTVTQDFELEFLGSWQAGPAMCFDLTRIDAEFYPATGLVYILGGRGGADGSVTDGNIYSFDPTTGTCADTGADMPFPISNYTINLVNNGTADVLCTFGGRGAAGTSILNVQCYNPLTNAATNVGNLPAAYNGFTPGGQAVVDNMVYVFGGFRNTAAPYELARTDRWDPITNTFTQIGDLSLGRAYLDVAVVDGKIYAFGGTVFDGTNLNAQTRTEVMADPGGAGTWDDAAVAELPTATGEGRAFGFDTGSPYGMENQIVIAAGGQWPAETAEVFVYDIASDTYDYSFPNLINARRDNAGAFVPLTTENPADGLPGMWVFGGRQGVDTPPYMPAEFYPLGAAAAEPDITVSPASLTQELCTDGTDSQTLQICNVGTLPLTWDLVEVGGAAPRVDWSENFDSYPTDQNLHGIGGWKGWGNVPGATAYTRDTQALSAPNSVEIMTTSDLVHEYSGYTSGFWTYTAWQYIPSTLNGDTYFILLNQYDDAGLTLNWSTEVMFSSATDTVSNDGPDGGTLPIVYDQWVEIRVEIDLDNNTQAFYYGGDLLFQGSWTEGMSGGGILNIAAVDLYANGATPVYYDDISLAAPDVVPWISESPTAGTVEPGLCADVTVTFDATGMTPGDYLATLQINSNDPQTPQIDVPVTLSVLEPVSGTAFTFTPTDPVAGEEISFAGTIELGGGTLTWAWDFGDGTTGDGQNVTHTYAAEGSYDVTLTVSNLCGDSVATQTVIVTPGGPVYDNFVFLPIVTKAYGGVGK